MFVFLLFLILFFLAAKFLVGAALYVAGGILGLLLVFIFMIIKRRR